MDVSALIQDEAGTWVAKRMEETEQQGVTDHQQVKWMEGEVVAEEELEVY